MAARAALKVSATRGGGASHFQLPPAPPLPPMPPHHPNQPPPPYAAHPLPTLGAAAHGVGGDGGGVPAVPSSVSSSSMLAGVPPLSGLLGSQSFDMLLSQPSRDLSQLSLDVIAGVGGERGERERERERGERGGERPPSRESQMAQMSPHMLSQLQSHLATHGHGAFQGANMQHYHQQQQAAGGGGGDDDGADDGTDGAVADGGGPHRKKKKKDDGALLMMHFCNVVRSSSRDSNDMTELMNLLGSVGRPPSARVRAVVRRSHGTVVRCSAHRRRRRRAGRNAPTARAAGRAGRNAPAKRGARLVPLLPPSRRRIVSRALTAAPLRPPSSLRRDCIGGDGAFATVCPAVARPVAFSILMIPPNISFTSPELELEGRPLARVVEPLARRPALPLVVEPRVPLVVEPRRGRHGAGLSWRPTGGRRASVARRGRSGGRLPRHHPSLTLASRAAALF